jgi:molecular chaperone DnaK (HSP70)
MANQENKTIGRFHLDGIPSMLPEVSLMIEVTFDY